MRDANGRREKIVVQVLFLVAVRFRFCGGKTGTRGTPIEDGRKITVQVLFLAAIRFRFCRGKTGEWGTPMARREKITVLVLFFGRPFPILRRQNWREGYANGKTGEK